MGYYLLLSHWALRGALFLSKGCFAVATATCFWHCCGAQNFCASYGGYISFCLRRQGGFALRRDLLLPLAAGVFSFFVSDGPISFNSERNGGKNAGKNCVFAFPHALRNVKTRFSLPHVRGSFPESFRQRTVSATAPLPLTGAPNNASASTVAPHERERRKREVSSSYGTTT